MNRFEIPKLVPVMKVLQTAGLVFFLLLSLTSCSSNDSKTSSGDGSEEGIKSENAEDKAAEASEDPDEIVEPSTETGKSSKTKKAPKKPKVSIEGKHTGITSPGVVVQQENEVLGLNLVKLSKYGIRMDSSTISVILRPGETAMAYNPNNGYSLPLTEKAASFMAGVKTSNKMGEELIVTEKGRETLCGKACIHYRLIKILKDPKTKKVYDSWAEDVWATKDVDVPPAILKECAKLVLLPKDLGFPVRIARFKNRSKSSPDVNRLKNLDMKATKDVIKTLSFEKQTQDSGDFVFLSGFKPAKDEMQFMMAGNEDELAGEEGLDDLDEPPTAKAN